MTNKACSEELSKACTSILLRSCDEKFRRKCYHLLMVSDTSTAYDVLKEKLQDILTGKFNSNTLQQQPDIPEVVSKKSKVVPEPAVDIETPPPSSEEFFQNSGEIEFFNLDVWSEK